MPPCAITPPKKIITCQNYATSDIIWLMSVLLQKAGEGEGDKEGVISTMKWSLEGAQPLQGAPA